MLQICKDKFFSERYLVVKNGWEIVAAFDTLEEAQQAYPGVEVGGSYELAE